MIPLLILLTALALCACAGWVTAIGLGVYLTTPSAIWIGCLVSALAGAALFFLVLMAIGDEPPEDE